ncbi:MAG: hypothetical protein ACYTF0_08520 [Planctomycetota bacterium]|jgi:hypothetical protein
MLRGLLCCLTALALIASSACTSSSSRRASATPAADAPVAVANMPPAPALPDRYDHTALREDIDAEALKVAGREVRSRDWDGQISLDERSAFVADSWWAAVVELQLAQPSEVPGLTVGQLRAQRAAPAFEEDHADLLGETTIEQRAIYLAWAWTPELEHRRELAQAAADERLAVQEKSLERARRSAEWRAEMIAHQRKMEALILAERAKSLSVLSDDERAELDRLVAEALDD